MYTCHAYIPAVQQAVQLVAAAPVHNYHYLSPRPWMLPVVACIDSSTRATAAVVPPFERSTHTTTTAEQRRHPTQQQALRHFSFCCTRPNNEERLSACSYGVEWAEQQHSSSSSGCSLVLRPFSVLLAECRAVRTTSKSHGPHGITCNISENESECYLPGTRYYYSSSNLEPQPRFGDKLTLIPTININTSKY